VQRWRGLKAMVVDAVDHGSRAVQRVHMETASLPFAILEQVPPLAGASPQALRVASLAKGVHAIHDAVATGVYASIRAVNHVASATLDVVIDVIEIRARQDPPEEPPKTQ
jgi:hypothetical protein